MDKYDINDLYWNNNTKLSEYLNFVEVWNGSNYLMLVYVNI